MSRMSGSGGPRKWPFSIERLYIVYRFILIVYTFYNDWWAEGVQGGLLGAAFTSIRGKLYLQRRLGHFWSACSGSAMPLGLYACLYISRTAEGL